MARSGRVLLILAILSSVIGISGCAPGRSEGVTRIRFGTPKAPNANRLSMVSILNGGLIIFAMGQNGTPNTSFQFGTEELAANGADLVNGEYKFYALGWDTASLQAMRCGMGNAGSSVTLTGADVTVSITMDAATCGTGDFSDTSFAPSGPLMPLVVHSCGNAASMNCAGATCGNCTSPIGGDAGSIRISLLNPGLVGGPGFTKCLQPGASGAPSATKVMFPLGVVFFAGDPVFPFVVETFPGADTTCSGPARATYLMSTGLNLFDPNLKLLRGTGAADDNHFYVDN